MKYAALPIALLLAGGAANAKLADAVKGPAEAIAIADAGTSNGVTGQYQMVVAATGKNLKATFLNSTVDYTGPDNLTFALSPVVARMFTKQYGAPPEEYLKGKRITVEGRVRRQTIVNLLYGKPRSINRIGHNVEIRQFAQIKSVE